MPRRPSNMALRRRCPKRVVAGHARVAGVAVSVRMVWPRRGADPAAFDADMERALQGVLQSVHVGAQSAKRP